MPDIGNRATWADEVGEEYNADVQGLPAPKIEQHADGTKTVISWRIAEDGRKIKTTRRIRLVTKTEKVQPAVAERKKWAKFGAEKGHPAGPDLTTTSVGENIPFRLSIGFKQREEAEESASAMRSKLVDRKITCRICKGEHFTTRCPYRDTLTPADVEPTGGPGDSPRTATPEPENTSGKYIPIHLRASNRGNTGDKMSFRERDDLATLRVTNLSEDTTEDDLRALFAPFGGLSRVFLARDKDTGRVKGFAFVSFYDRANAMRAAEKRDGFGFLNLILRVELAKRQ